MPSMRTVFYYVCGTYYALLCFSKSSSAAPLPPNWLLGIKYISYNNIDGTLANGNCCDEPGKTAGHCTPNKCDTSFYMCGTNDPASLCNLIAHQGTATTYNSNTVKFGSRIGNGLKTSTSFWVLKFPFNKNDTNITINAYEEPDIGLTIKSEEIAQFAFLVNWIDPIYLNPPTFRRFVLNDTRARLVVDVVSQCTKHYYTEDCSVYCRPNKVHYTCTSNGTIQCLPGWSGSKCLTMIDYCPGNKCQHNSTCVPVLLNYRCLCAQGFTGRYCQTPIPTPAVTVSTPTTVLTNQSVSTTTGGTGDDGGDDVDVGLIVGASLGGLLILSSCIGIMAFCLTKNKRSQVSTKQQWATKVIASRPPLDHTLRR